MFSTRRERESPIAMITSKPFIPALLILLSQMLAGCDLMAIKAQHQQFETLCDLSGRVAADHPQAGNLVVVLFRHEDGPVSKPASWKLVDHFALEHPGPWFFFINPGQYLLTAFEDRNRNQVVEPNEPVLPVDYGKTFECRAGEPINRGELVVPESGRMRGHAALDLADLRVRSALEQMDSVLGQAVNVGAVTALKDARFSRENAGKGLWRPFDFIMERKAGLYFLEPYTPAKTPVVFVHGMNGTPLDFEGLIDRLDRSRFQPWVLFYPSGGSLERIGNVLWRMIEQTHLEYGYRHVLFVAHSMGGLVVRQALLNESVVAQDLDIPLFISLATPWGGHDAAQIGVDYAPTAAYSWIDMAPGSQFLRELYADAATAGRRRLPAGLSQHLVFSFLPAESGDGTVSLASQLRSEAQEESTRLYGFQQSHDGVLTDPAVRALIYRLLETGRQAGDR